MFFSKLYNFWQIIKDSLWFTPAVFCVGFAFVTMGLYQAEIRYFPAIELPELFFSGGNDEAKSVSLALLSSMITMTTLAISITMVVLSLAASQLGPRLIRAFMSDKSTQNFIGLFFGTVIACFLITIILHDAGWNKEIDTPRVTISALFAMCFVNLFILLGFVNHVARSGSADYIIACVTDDLLHSLDRLSVDEDRLKHADFDKDKGGWPKDFERKKQALTLKKSGYLQHIDYMSLLETGRKHGLYIEITFKPGHFVVEKEQGIFIYTANEKIDDALKNKIRDSFIIGQTRTSTQDPEYSIRHLVEIGLRAQSPSMNDNFTAITVLDRLSSALAVLFEKNLQPAWFADEDGKVRLFAQQSDEADLIFSAFDQMRYNAIEQPDILYHILKKINVLSDLAQHDLHRQGLKRQLREIEHTISSTMKDDVRDMAHMEALCHRVLEKC